jgi:hypothetical protein
MSPDASTLLHILPLIETGKVRGSGSIMEWLLRGLSRITLLLTGVGGSLTMIAVMITFKSLREKKNSLERLPSFLAPKNDLNIFRFLPQTLASYFATTDAY